MPECYVINGPSLREAQRNFIECGAAEKRCVDFSRRSNKSDKKFMDWKPL